MNGQKFSPAWLQPHVGYVTYWLLKGVDRETVHHMLQRAKGYADITDDEFNAVHSRALSDARASMRARSCGPETKVGDCFK